MNPIFDGVLLTAAMVAKRPDTILVSPAVAAMIDVFVTFHGRDRRRIKRELNKAAKRARKVAA